LHFWRLLKVVPTNPILRGLWPRTQHELEGCKLLRAMAGWPISAYESKMA
jgi:hypothetical protein